MKWLFISLVIALFAKDTATAEKNLVIVYPTAHNYPKPFTHNDAMQVNCLAQNVYFEARDQPIAGQKAVINVVFNRVKSKKFPNTICKVITQGGIKRHKCQFSWYCSSDRIPTVNDIRSWNKIYKLSLKIYNKRLQHEIIDNTHGALFYHANYVEPYWSRHMTKTVSIGDHIFYRS